MERTVALYGSVPDKLLAAKRSFLGLAELLNGGSVPVNQLLLAEISESKLEVLRFGRVPVKLFPRSTRRV